MAKFSHSEIIWLKLSLATPPPPPLVTWQHFILPLLRIEGSAFMTSDHG